MVHIMGGMLHLRQEGEGDGGGETSFTFTVKLDIAGAEPYPGPLCRSLPLWVPL